MKNSNTHNWVVAGSNPAEPTSEPDILLIYNRSIILYGAKY